MNEYIVTMNIKLHGVTAYVTAKNLNEAKAKIEAMEWADIELDVGEIVDWNATAIEENL